MYDEPVNLNGIQMTGRYGKEVYLEVDIMVIDITQLSTNTQIKYIREKTSLTYGVEKKPKHTELSIKRTTNFNCHKNKITYRKALRRFN